MSDDRIYTGNIVRLLLDTTQDVTSATLMEIRCTKPDGTEVAWPAAQYSTNTSISYITNNSDLDLPGNYIIRSYVEWGTASDLGDSVILEVYDADEPSRTETNSYGRNPYTANNLTGSKVDAIRLLLRITSEPWELSNEEIQYYIDENPRSDMRWVAYKVAESIFGNYADQCDRTMGPLSISLSQKFDHWQKVAQQMKIAATTGKVQSPSPVSSCNGSKKFSVGDMDMYNNPAAYDQLRYEY
jgi:hypothetical protein